MFSSLTSGAKKSPRADKKKEKDKDEKKGTSTAGLDRDKGKKPGDVFDMQLPSGGRSFNPDLFGQMVQRGFSKLYENEALSDITLIVGPSGSKKKESRVRAHRTVLCVWSDTFRAMLETHDRWKESSLAELRVEIEESEVDIFLLMLKYMYTGETDFITGENVIPLISLSNYYGVHSLKGIPPFLLVTKLIFQDTNLVSRMQNVARSCLEN